MSELSGNVKQLCAYLNKVFPGGALFLVATETELKRFLMEMTTNILEAVTCRKINAARMIGYNNTPDGNFWVFSPNTIIDSHGMLQERDNSPLLWLERPSMNSPNLLIDNQLTCTISDSLDNGEALLNLCEAAQAFMPENTISTLAAMSCFVMGASYTQVISKCGCIGVPILFGEPGSCKSEALKCGLALFGALRTHLYNSQTTPSFLFDSTPPFQLELMMSV